MTKTSKRKKSIESYGVLILAVSLVLVASALAVMYFLTKYIPFLLVSLMLYMPALVNLALIIPLKKYEVSAFFIREKTGEGKPRFWKRLKIFFVNTGLFFQRMWRNICNKGEYIIIGFCAVVAIVTNYIFWKKFLDFGAHKLGYIMLCAIAVLFVVLIVLDKLAKHMLNNIDDSKIKAIVGNIRSSAVWGEIILVLLFAVMAFCIVGFFDIQKYLVFALSLIFAYQTLFTVMAFAIRAIKHELFTEPDITVPIGKRNSSLGLIAYLEENTGITMRSLWSIRIIKRSLPVAVVSVVAILWLSTAIVQIEPYQKGAVYRFGILKKDALESGVHLTLPWPIDKVKVYDTDSVKELTIGYLSADATDNLWTEAHGNNEYKLLLGGGNELVSINLRVEYKIQNLKDYLSCSRTPELLLESAAYQAVTNRTVNTDLNTILATDRAEFSKSFKAELIERISKYQTGLEVVDVIIESIHPPVEVAEIYQKLISSEIEAQQLLIEAQASAGVTISQAQKEYDSTVYHATSQSHEKIADATASVSEFMASVEADKTYGDTYRYQKYIDALKEAYSGANIIIVGDGVDSSSIYLGSLS